MAKFAAIAFFSWGGRGEQVIGDGLDFALSIDAGDGGLTFGQEQAFAFDFVGVVEADGGLLDEFCDEGELFVETGGLSIADFEFGDDEEDALSFEISVAVSECAEEFDTADFEVLGIDRVVQIPHGIGFGVANSDGQFDACEFDARRFGVSTYVAGFVRSSHGGA